MEWARNSGGGLHYLKSEPFSQPLAAIVTNPLHAGSEITRSVVGRYCQPFRGLYFLPVHASPIANRSHLAGCSIRCATRRSAIDFRPFAPVGSA